MLIVVDIFNSIFKLNIWEMHKTDMRQATSYRRQVTGDKLPATSYRRQVTGDKLPFCVCRQTFCVCRQTFCVFCVCRQSYL